MKRTVSLSIAVVLLSTYVHEQIHWFLTQNSKSREEAKKELRGMFPKVPVAFKHKLVPA
jgi:hypothetical protein